ncbi:hypothetical protein CDAR_80461 [Caerostris darwini]|uniref:Uncharacterized protein n=1 Tax=Caerostris darwini TaxID=1538125 RepID=A0AAV4X312_9ARAC|nr:hypothetical protein CDAR_80461 [Caerostris darwini]
MALQPVFRVTCHRRRREIEQLHEMTSLSELRRCYLNSIFFHLALNRQGGEVAKDDAWRGIHLISLKAALKIKLLMSTNRVENRITRAYISELYSRMRLITHAYRVRADLNG